MLDLVLFGNKHRDWDAWASELDLGSLRGPLRTEGGCSGVMKLTCGLKIWH